MVPEIEENPPTHCIVDPILFEACLIDGFGFGLTHQSLAVALLRAPQPSLVQIVSTVEPVRDVYSCGSSSYDHAIHQQVAFLDQISLSMLVFPRHA